MKSNLSHRMLFVLSSTIVLYTGCKVSTSHEGDPSIHETAPTDPDTDPESPVVPKPGPITSDVIKGDAGTIPPATGGSVPTRPENPVPGMTEDPRYISIDYAKYPINLMHLEWISPVVRNAGGEGFRFDKGRGDGQRVDQNGVQWPDEDYYEKVLGSFQTMAQWDMRSVIIYNTPKPGGWKKEGWHHYQDMAEGGTCVDDTSRGAIAVIDRYLTSEDDAVFNFARSYLNWLGYMVTREGRVYNFAWLDAPKFFTKDKIQSTNGHYMARFDMVKRWRYPSSYSQGSFGDDPEGMVKNPESEPAPPYRSHPRYSVVMNDLRDIHGNSSALVYDAPLYDKVTGERAGVQRGVTTAVSTSHMGFNAWTARNLWAFAKAHGLIQKRRFVKKALSQEDIVFARFIENHFNRMLRFVMTQPLESMDVKQNAVIISALSDYLRIQSAASGMPAYVFELPANSNTAETSDDRVSKEAIQILVDKLVLALIKKQYRSNDWRNGIFLDNHTSGTWNAWGELQIQALATYAMQKFEAGDRSSNGAGFRALTSATIAAEGFYGEAYRYRKTGEDYKLSRERITAIEAGWKARYHNTPGSPQLNFGQSNMIAGLYQLAKAWEKSGAQDAARKRDLYLKDLLLAGSWYLGNNTAFTPMYIAYKGTMPFEGRGAVLDAIDARSDGTYGVNASSGGEGNVEGLRAMILIHDAIQTYTLEPKLKILKQ